MDFSKGRLTAIIRHGETHSMAYDRFGRVTQDGDPVFAYDENGNRTEIMYFAGRPVAVALSTSAQPTSAELTFYSTDYRHAPLVVTNDTPEVVWDDGIQPFGFGKDALETDIFLRLPGQWQDKLWNSEDLWSNLHYNVHRWYQHETGRYTRPDPYEEWPIFQTYGYAEQNPVLWVDPDGRIPIPNPFGPFFKVGCVFGATARAATGLAGPEGPRWAHCIASCEITKCGGGSLAFNLGMAKEGFDTITCLTLTRLDRVGSRSKDIIRDKHCDSAFQKEDLQDNRGITCPRGVSCSDRCDRLKGKQAAAGPFGIVPALDRALDETFGAR